MSDQVNALIDGMLSDESQSTRLRCAVGLMKHTEYEVQQAYVKALDDPFDKVVQLSCREVGWRGEVAAVERLRNLLNHALWEVRIAACHGLISLQVVDAYVIEKLEELSLSPEADEYNSDIEEIRELNQEEYRVRDADVFGTLDFILSELRK